MSPIDVDTATREMIELYSRLGVEGVTKDETAHRFLAANRQDPQFNEELERVRDVELQLETAADGQIGQNQVSSALEVFNSLKSQPDSQRYARELATCRYGKRWTKRQCRYFDDACDKLACDDYFLSFTNYNPARGEVQLINSEHRRLIVHTLANVYRKPEIVRTNMFARVIRYYLVNNGLNGYWDPTHRGPGDVAAILTSRARSALAFVQVVQGTMFDKWPNYCLLEYEAAAEDESKALIFVVPHSFSKFKKRYLVDYRMHRWYDAIARNHVVEVEPSTTMSAIRAAVDEIETQIVDKVRRLREDLIEGAPASSV